MKLDCVKNDSNGWKIIDLDDSYKLIAEGDGVEDVWYLAAMKLEKMVNKAQVALYGT